MSKPLPPRTNEEAQALPLMTSEVHPDHPLPPTAISLFTDTDASVQEVMWDIDQQRWAKREWLPNFGYLAR